MYSQLVLSFGSPKETEEACLLAWQKGLFVRWVTDSNKLMLLGGEEQIREMGEYTPAGETISVTEEE